MLFDRLNQEENARPSAGASRRDFLRAGISAGGGLLISVSLGAFPALARAAGAAAETFSPNAYVHIGIDGVVTLTMPFVEMGQGTYTSIPMLIAEELEVDLKTVRLQHAPPDDKLYANGVLGFQATGGSTSIRSAYEPMRRAGATARLMLIEAAARRWQVDAASCQARSGQVLHAASGRTLRYGQLVADAGALPLPATVVLKPRADFKLVGRPAKRLDSAAKVNGTAVYGIDARVPGMKVATLAQSPVFGGKLRSVDDSKAKAVKGVRQIVQLEDCVAVVADHMGAALKGLAALDIVWDDGPNAKLDTAAILASMQAASAHPGAVAIKEGDSAKALAQAAVRLEAVYELPFLIHGAMEPLNCTVHVTKDSCELWVGTQVITRAQAAAAAVTGLPLEKVIVRNHYLGGGFGRRLEIDSITRAVQIAQQVAGPVKVIWTREEDVQHDMYRPFFYDRISGALGADGMPVAWSHRITGSSVVKRWNPAGYNNGFDPETVNGAHPPYAIPNLLVDYVNHEPVVPTAFWRGVGPAHNIFVVESFIDEMAATAKQDPVAYRSALLGKNPRAKAVLELASQKAGWGEKMPAGQGRGVSVQFAFGTYLALVAEVTVGSEGQVAVSRVVAAVDAGVIVNPDTVLAQMHSAIIFGISAALYGQATLKDGRIEQSNFHDVRVLRINETPKLEVHIVPSNEAPGGMGEPGTAALAPAVTNAVFAATGKRIRKLPINADR